MQKSSRWAATLVVACLFAAARLDVQIDTVTLRPVGYHPNVIAYYNAPYFANALYQGSEWLEFAGFEFGTPVDSRNAQFENGYPRSLQPGQKLGAIVYGLNADYDSRPPGWPSRTHPARWASRLSLQ